jgi:predicted Rossmann-fold nucleotide-binding protein
MLEFHDFSTLKSHLAASRSLSDSVITGLDFRGQDISFDDVAVEASVFLGCHLDAHTMTRLVSRGALVFPALPTLVYEPWRTTLYSPDELFRNFNPKDPCTYCDTLDARIYAHFLKTGGADEAPLLEAFARRLHDHGISEALEALLAKHPRVVAFMGGHAMRRDDPAYLRVAQMAGRLSRAGFLVATGGGPGAMEAANLGARFGRAPEGTLENAVAAMASAPVYSDRHWLTAAFEVLEKSRGLLDHAPVTLGVPTFFYGHEPPNVFATHHAKYFANSTREEGLVSLATHGIVFAPGAAGTVQEIFQDACQNHYGTVRREVAPMVLFGKRFWSEEMPVWPVLEALAARAEWSDRLLLTDDANEAHRFLESLGPRRRSRTEWSYCRAFCAESHP